MSEHGHSVTRKTTKADAQGSSAGRLLRVSERVTALGGASEESYYLASQWQLMWRKFRRHHLALVGGVILGLLYLAALGADFVAPYDPNELFDHIHHPPSRIRFVHDGRFVGPFVYGVTDTFDREAYQSVYAEDTAVRYRVRLFARGAPYRFAGLFPLRLHLIGAEAPGTVFLFGTDTLGRDLFSRTLHAARISLSIGLVGVALSFLIGTALGGVSGYYGGRVDTFVQRCIEFLISLPTIPLWMALAAALPHEWSVLQIYFGIVIILSLVSWGGLARVVRGKLLELREHDFVMAAQIGGLRELTIIRRHLLPSFASYLIVHLTLAIPRMILAETALSFLGLGLRSPALSWGVLLQRAQNFRSVAIYPWLLIPAAFVIITVMAFNFVGDGLRDAADPYKQ